MNKMKSFIPYAVIPVMLACFGLHSANAAPAPTPSGGSGGSGVPLATAGTGTGTTVATPTFASNIGKVLPNEYEKGIMRYTYTGNTMVDLLDKDTGFWVKGISANIAGHLIPDTSKDYNEHHRQIELGQKFAFSDNEYGYYISASRGHTTLKGHALEQDRNTYAVGAYIGQKIDVNSIKRKFWYDVFEYSRSEFTLSDKTNEETYEMYVASNHIGLKDVDRLWVFDLVSELYNNTMYHRFKSYENKNNKDKFKVSSYMYSSIGTSLSVSKEYMFNTTHKHILVEPYVDAFYEVNAASDVIHTIQTVGTAETKGKSRIFAGSHGFTSGLIVKLDGMKFHGTYSYVSSKNNHYPTLTMLFSAHF